MHAHLRTAQQLARLNRSRLQLLKKGHDSEVIHQEVLVPLILRFHVQRLELEGRADRYSTRQIEEALVWSCRQIRSPKEFRLEDLIELNRILVGQTAAAGFREVEAPPSCENHQPMEPGLVPRALERFFQWLGSDSFGEMHAVEQMTLAQTRLTEIFPFKQGNHLTVWLFSAACLRAGSFLLPCYSIEEWPRFYEALSEAFHLSTQPLVDFNLNACLRSYDAVGAWSR